MLQHLNVGLRRWFCETLYADFGKISSKHELIFENLALRQQLATYTVKSKKPNYLTWIVLSGLR